jgi:hypothetical protein
MAKNKIIQKIRKTLGLLFLIIHSLYTVSTHSFELFSMSGYYSDGQGTLSITSSESDAGLQEDDESSISWGDEEPTTSHVTEKGRTGSLTCISSADMFFCL